jgi:PEP-CTERM motif-containing protein
MQRRIATFLVSLVTLVFAAAPALAGTSHLSGTVTTTVPTNFSDDSSTNAANATGASNANFLTVQNTTPNVSGTWIVSAGLSTTGFTSSSVPITFWVQSPNVSNITVTITQIQFSDGTTTISSGTISQSLTITNNNTLTSTGFTTDLSTYSNYSSINLANVNSVIIDFSLTTSQGNNKQFQLDAVDFASAVPEPATIGLFALGAAGLACAVRRRRKKAVCDATASP